MPESRAAAGEHERLLAALAAGDTVVLTASRRLARAIHRDYGARVLARGDAVWSTPAVHLWSDWIDGLLVESAGGSTARPLSAAAAHVVWEKLVRRRLGDDVLAIGSLARQAAQAWQRIHDWCVPVAEVVRRARSRDEVAFAGLIEDYRRFLRRRKRFDAAEAPAIAVGLIGKGRVDLPSSVLFAGFDRIPPVIETIRAAIRDRGVLVDAAGLPYVAGGASLVSCPDEESELRAAGAWARDCLERDAQAVVGIVVTELERDAGRVSGLVREGFAPGWQSASPAWEASVETSYGRPLDDYPMVAAALLALRLGASGLRSAEVSMLMRSPLIAADDAAACAALERRLRRLPDRRWTPFSLERALASEDAVQTTPAWFGLLAALRSLRADDGAADGGRDTRLAVSAWAARLDALLAAAGWPGLEPLDSSGFQLLNRWRELLNDFARLDDVLGPVSFEEATGRLAALAADTLFQPERPGGMLRVLGPLEAAGMRFDCLRVVRCDAERWPAPGRPSSLISRALQADYGMPDATPSDTLAYSRRVLDRLAASAPEVVFSYSRTDLDAARLPSPLLRRLISRAEQSAADPGWYAARLAGKAPVRQIDPDPVPAVRAVETISGGARTVQLQRSDPFSAFAAGRLGIRDLEPFEPGLSASLRGSLTHDALCRLYADRPGRDDIAGWSSGVRAGRIDVALDEALARAERDGDALMRKLLHFERQRMRSLLAELLQADSEREPFAVAEVEHRLDFEHAGARFELRADRIDRLADGSLLIIDYKTGRRRPLAGRDGSPVDLQVVVYAVALRQRIGGLALLYVHRHGIQPVAVGSSIEWRPQDEAEWTAMLARWKAEVFTAIEAMAAGDVRVNIRGDQERSRQLDILCRAAELRRDR